MSWYTPLATTTQLLVAIIPAKGTSSRVPRKNWRPFNGRPMMSYPIMAAQASGLFHRIYVSTDSSEVAEVAELYGAMVIARPLDLADHITGTQEVMKHALNQVGADIACCIYPTAAMIKPQDLKDGLDRLVDGIQYVYSVRAYDAPILKALRLHDTVNNWDGVFPVWPQYSEHRSQDLGDVYHDAGQWYWGRAEAFRSDVPLYGRHAVGVPIPNYRCIDIDTEDDWTRAELMCKAL